ncbi:hypothetical protein [Acidocella sp.]|jgi:hypothetical protein|uniref:hypothetical protein n=1 Tax=Acidocella sp. TaxID=50710 RepID=UPI002F416F67
MFKFTKILPAIALAVVLSPLAAQAHTAQQAQGSNQTLVQSGPANQQFPDSVGG